MKKQEEAHTTTFQKNANKKIDAVVKSYHQELDKRAQKIMSGKK